MIVETDQYQNALNFLKECLADDAYELDDSKIVYNAMKTPDGTVIESVFRHDYVEHTDTNGKTYAVDGGLAYLRRSGDHGDCEELSVGLNDDYEVVRCKFTWGKSTEKGVIRIRLDEISLNHLITLFKYYQLQCDEYDGSLDILRLFLMEGAFRNNVKENHLLLEGEFEGEDVYLFPKWPKTLQ